MLTISSPGISSRVLDLGHRESREEADVGAENKHTTLAAFACDAPVACTGI